MTRHQRDPATGIVMPRKVRIEWPTANFEMTIELAELQINKLTGDPAALFAMPQYPGYVNIDLAAPPPQAGLPPQATPMPLPAPQ